MTKKDTLQRLVNQALHIAQRGTEVDAARVMQSNTQPLESMHTFDEETRAEQRLFAMEILKNNFFTTAYESENPREVIPTPNENYTSQEITSAFEALMEHLHPDKFNLLAEGDRQDQEAYTTIMELRRRIQSASERLHRTRREATRRAESRLTTFSEHEYGYRLQDLWTIREIIAPVPNGPALEEFQEDRTVLHDLIQVLSQGYLRANVVDKVSKLSPQVKEAVIKVLRNTLNETQFLPQLSKEQALLQIQQSGYGSIDNCIRSLSYMHRHGSDPEDERKVEFVISELQQVRDRIQQVKNLDEFRQLSVTALTDQFMEHTKDILPGIERLTAKIQSLISFDIVKNESQIKQHS